MTSSSAQAVFRTQRVLAHPPAAVYGAFADTALLARWWGPAGFRNEVEHCDFRPGGRWRFVMHAPDGKHFRNESEFRELTPPSRVVIAHISKPHYLLTVGIEPSGAQGAHSLVTWNQVFEDAGVAAKVRAIVEPANEQNLDRLQAVLEGREPQ